MKVTQIHGYFFPAECEPCGINCQTGRNLLCRPQPGGGQRAGRRAAGADRAERHRQPPQTTVIAAAITSRTGKAKLPTHIELPGQSSGLPRDSIILLEQIRTLDKKRLREKMGRVEDDIMQQVDAAIAVSFGLPHERLV